MDRRTLAFVTGCAMSLGARAAASFDAVLDRLEDASSQNSPDIRTAEALRRQKANARYTAWTGWMPHVNLVAAQTRAKSYDLFKGGQLPAELFGGTTPTASEVETKRWELQASMPIYRRDVHIGISQAHLELDAAEITRDTRTTEHAWKFRERLGKLLLAAYRRATARGALETAQTALKEAKARFELGQKTKIDVLRAESNLTGLEARVLSESQSFVVERQSFLNESGLESAEFGRSGLEAFLDAEAKTLEAIDRFAARTDRVLDALKPWLSGDEAARNAQITSKNLNYQSIVTADDISRLRAHAVVAQEWPSVSLSASLSNIGDTWKEAAQNDERSYSYGVTLSIPLFSGGSLVSRVREAWAAEEAARVDRARNLQGVFTEVEGERLQLLALTKSVESNQLRVSRDEEILRLSQKSYQLGKTTTLELLTAQNDLLSSKVDLADTKIKLEVLARRFAWNLGVDTK